MAKAELADNGLVVCTWYPLAANQMEREFTTRTFQVGQYKGRHAKAYRASCKLAFHLVVVPRASRAKSETDFHGTYALF
jgi:hypothetical protein